MGKCKKTSKNNILITTAVKFQVSLTEGNISTKYASKQKMVRHETLIENTGNSVGVNTNKPDTVDTKKNTKAQFLVIKYHSGTTSIYFGPRHPSGRQVQALYTSPNIII